MCRKTAELFIQSYFILHARITFKDIKHLYLIKKLCLLSLFSGTHTGSLHDNIIRLELQVQLVDSATPSDLLQALVKYNVDQVILEHNFTVPTIRLGNEKPDLMVKATPNCTTTPITNG